MAKSKYIRCDIYKRGVFIFIGGLEELKKWVVKELTDKDEKEFVDMMLHLTEDELGAASFNFDMNCGQSVVHIPKFPESPKEIAEFVHELMHATFFLMNFIRVDYDKYGNNEAFTYLMEHLTRNAFELDGYEEIVKDQ